MPRLVRRLALIIGGLSPALVLPAAAAAQSPPPAPGAMSIKLERVVHVGHDDAALRGDRVRVRGTVAPYVAGQTVRVRVQRGRRSVATKDVPVQPLPGGARGGFVVSLMPPAGRLTVRASHRATAAQAAMVAKARRVLVLTPHAAPGARGPTVRLLQSRLAALHYVVSRSGVFDASTARAVIAYRKVTGRQRIALASRDVLRGLVAGRGAFRVRHPEHGKHVEVDLSRQVIALVRGRRVERIYGVSSGKPSTPTVLGRFRVYSKVPGTNAKGMVDTSYFIGGYAIHGYVSVPTFPASHGCVRVPVPNALSIYRWLRLGDRVDVYR
jgi:peptidoglycan hydrolase-like protein with peptidoglycan-binding domain